MVHVPLSPSTQYRLLICLFLLTGLLLGAGGISASAQQPVSPADTTGSKVHVPTGDSTARKLPDRALAYSTVGTVVPMFIGIGVRPLLAAGFFLGPSAGHFYAQDYTQALVGIGIRVGAPLLMGSVLSPLGPYAGVGGTVFVGLPISAISVVYDVVTADDSARAYNETHAARIHVAPTVGPRGEQVGLSLRVSF